MLWILYAVAVHLATCTVFMRRSEHSGSGTAIDPYWSLSAALSHSSEAEIIVLGPDSVPFVSDGDSPQFGEMLTVGCYQPQDRPLLLINDIRAVVQLVTAVTVEFQGLEVSGKALLWTDCPDSEEWCKHCLNDNLLIDGEITPIEGKNVSALPIDLRDRFICQQTEETYFFLVAHRAATLTFVNCVISHIRSRPHAVFLVFNGALRLSNTDIFAVAADRYEAAVVLFPKSLAAVNSPYVRTLSHELLEECAFPLCGELEITGGKVTGVNRDHAFSRSNDRESGFLLAQRVHTVKISGVTFEDNQLSTVTFDDRGFVTLVEVGAILIEHCLFAHTMGVAAVLYISSSRTFAPPALINSPQITIIGCSFHSVFAQRDASALIIHSTGMNPIVEVSEVEIVNAHSFASSSVVRLDMNAENYEGDFQYVYPDDPTATAYTLTPGYILFTNTTLQSCSVGIETGSHMDLENGEKIVLTGMQFLSNGFSADTTVFDYFALQGLLPLSQETRDRFAVVDSCLAAVSIINASHLEVESWRVVDTHCDTGISITSPRDSVLFTQVSISEFTALGNTLSLMLSHTNSFVLLITHSSFTHNKAAIHIQNYSKRQAISSNPYFPHSAETVIEDSAIEDNIDTEGYSGISYYGGMLTVRRVTFRRNVSNGNAGVYALLLFDAEGRGARVSIEKCQFEENRSLGHFAPDIELDSEGTLDLSPQKIDIVDCTFKRSYGGSIAFQNLRLGAGSLKSQISKCEFLYTVPTVLGVVYLSHISGEVVVSSSLFSHCNSVTNGTGNCGVFALSSTNAPDAITKTTVERCKFQYGDAESCILVEANPLQRATLDTMRCEFLHNRASGVDNDGGVYSDDSSVFFNNTAHYGPGLIANQGSVTTLRNSTFTNNKAIYEGGGFSLSGPDSIATITDCVVSNNSAHMKGGAATFQDDVIVIVIRMTVTHNSANSASTFYFGDVTVVPARFVQCLITDNTGELLMLAIESKIEFEQVVIRGNHPLKLDEGIELMLSEMVTIDCVFEDLSGAAGCLFSLILESAWHDRNSVVRSGFCSESIVEVQQSMLSMNGTSFSNLTTKLIAVIYAERDSNVEIFGASFTDNVELLENSSLIFADQSSLKIVSSKIERNTGTSVHAVESLYIVIDRSVISHSVSQGEAQVFLINTERVDISASKFENLSARAAGAIEMRNDHEDGYAVIQSSDFVQCSGRTGAVALSGVSGLASSSSFTGNHGYLNGGGLFFNCSCSFEISASQFMDNHAVAGGGVFWLRTAPSFAGLEFARNTAEYGADKAAPATQLQLLNNSLLTAFPSGQVVTETLKFELIDELGQTVTSDNSTYAKIVSQDKDSLVSGSVESKAVQGVLHFQGFAIVAKPGQTHEFYVDIDNDEVRSFNFSIQFRNCDRGEILISDACSVCPQTTYSLEANSSLCSPCPNGAECIGGLGLYPKSGYWRSSTKSSKLWECFSSGACLGHKEFTSLTGLCAEGYTGQICQSCKRTYARTGRDDCSKCSSLSITLIRVFGLSAGGIVFLLLLVKSTMSNVKSNKFTSVYYRIFLNYLQLTVLTTTFDLKWPKIAKLIFNTQDAVGGASQEFFSYDCVYYEVGFQESIIYQDLVVVSVIPLVSLCFTSAVWVVVAVVKQQFAYLRQQNILSTIVVFFVVYPKLVNSVFSLFNCFSVEGTLWLREDMALQCWDSKHRLYSLAVALPSIAIWIIGAPLCVLMVLYAARERLQLTSVKLKFGFLYMGYTREFYYWEFVILARKVVVLSVFVFTSTSSVQLQALTMLILLLIALLLQLKFRPFINDELNFLEFKAIFTTAVTLICGLYYLSSDLSAWLELLLLVLIVAANGYFLGSWAKCLLRVYAFHAIGYCPERCLKFFGWVPSIRSIITSEHPRVVPIKSKYEQDFDDQSSADMSNSHRDRSKIAPEPMTFMMGISVPPTPPDNTPGEER